MSSFLLKNCDLDQEWDNFVARSPQGSVFAQSWFLKAMPNEVVRCFLLEGDKPVAAALIHLQDGQVLQAPRPFALYQGVFLGEDMASLPHHSRAKRVLEVLGAFFPLLQAKYKKLSFCLPASFDDLRAFQWHNYHGQPQEKFQMVMSFTGIVSLDDHRDFEGYLRGVRNTRRQEYNKGLRVGMKAEESTDLSLMRQLEERTFERQGIQLQTTMLDGLVSLCKAALAAGQGSLLLCRTEIGELASATFFLLYKDTAYYLVGANDPTLRKSNSGTFLMIENIRRFYERGIRKIDMIGINSPNRGDFKTSFDAAPVPYYTISLGFQDGARKPT